MCVMSCFLVCLFCFYMLLCEGLSSSTVVQDYFISFQMPLDVSSGFWDILMCSGGQRGLRSDLRADCWGFQEKRAWSDGWGVPGMMWHRVIPEIT